MRSRILINIGLNNREEQAMAMSKEHKEALAQGRLEGVPFRLISML